MLHKKLASKLKLLVENPKVWEVTEEYLQELKNQTHQALVMAQSEQEMFRNQGKAILLGQLLKLKDTVRDFEKK